MNRKRRIVVIGAGNVGQAVAYTLMVRLLAGDIVIIDANPERAESAAKDVAHGTGFFNQITVRAGDYSDCKGADLIILTAGAGRKAGQSRLELAEENAGIVRDISRNIRKYNAAPLILVVTNPVDIMTSVVLEETGVHRNRIIGSGTSLDTARFRYLISEQTGADVSAVNAYVIGEHGDSQVAVWSDVHIAGLPLEEYERQMGVKVDRDYVDEHTRKGGAEIIAGKGATFYGVAMAVSVITDMIVHDTRGIIPVAHRMDERFGSLAGVTISMPCMLGADGIVRTLELPLSVEERNRLEKSAEALRDFDLKNS